MTEVELSRALLLTYAGVGAAFVVLGSLIVYTLLLGGLGNWRARRQAAARQRQQPQEETAPVAQPVAAAAAAAAKPPAELPNLDPQLAAAIAAAVAMAQEMQRRERAERAADRAEISRPAADSAGSSGWKEQGRIAAFDTRRLRERER